MKRRCNGLKNLDFYGKTVGLHYDGDDKMRSRTGAFATICTLAVILIISTQRFLLLTNKEHFQTFSQHELIGMYEGMSTAEDNSLYAPSGHFNEE